MLTGKTVMVTGATGFVGGRLVEKLILEQNATVRALVRNYSSAARLGRFQIEMIHGDITDEAAVRKAVEGSDYIFHCAHESSLGMKKQKQMATVGTQNVCEAALAASVEQMVHVSTYAVYGPTLDGDLTESTPWQATDHAYVQSKRAAEELVKKYYQEKQLPVTIVQPTLVYGPYCKVWTHKPIADLKSGIVPLVNGGEGYANAIYIDDLVDMMILAATQPAARGETFLVSNPTPVTWKQFYGAFEEALGFKSTVTIDEEKLLELQKQQQKSTSNSAQLLKLARDPKVVSSVIRTRPVQMSLGVVKNFLSKEQRKSLKSRIFSNGNGKRHRRQQIESQEKSLHIPDEALLAFYRSRTHVRIDKAKKILGYNPRFDFGRGMELTSQYIQWANLK